MPKLNRSAPPPKPDTYRLPEDHLIEQAEKVFAEVAEVDELPKVEVLPQAEPGTKAVLKAPVREEERRPFDDYPTEPGWTHALLDTEEFFGPTLEPAAGAGWMVQVLQERGLDVVYTDLERDGVDFLTQDYNGEPFQNVITNPPYKYLDQFAAKALEVAQRKVALLLPDFALVGVNRTRDLWQAHPPKKLILVTSKMKVLGKVSMFPHVWVVWDKEYSGPTTWEWATVPKELRLDTSKAVPNLRSQK